MSIRSSLPDPIRTLVRHSYVMTGSLTARFRPVPDMIVIGGQRCGTTSLFRALEQHRHIVRPTFNKGINYFDINYNRGSRWYRGHFPVATAKNAPRTVTFEASGYYLFHPLAAERIAQDLPSVKIVAMLRDPAERAFSAWKHESARGYESEPFLRALELEPERLDGVVERMQSDPTFHSTAFRHQAYTARSDYIPLLQRYYHRLPAEQIHVMYSEDYFVDPGREFDRLLTFLDLPAQAGIVHDQHNARRSGSMPEEARLHLQQRFAGQEKGLEELTGRRPPWSAST